MHRKGQRIADHVGNFLHGVRLVVVRQDKGVTLPGQTLNRAFDVAHGDTSFFGDGQKSSPPAEGASR